ncbi:MAG: competence/damage-inducible protein A [Negativicutes bacterium]
MNVEIVSTGTELLLGQIDNTTAAYLAREFNSLGFSVLHQATVGDNPARLREVIAQALKRSDIVVTTGGLGPTLGDITKQAVAEVLQVTMVFDEVSAGWLKDYFRTRNLNMPERNLRQAYFPAGTEIVPNAYGTAPCVYLNCQYENEEKLIIQLPGPPRELKGVFRDEMVPRLKRDYERNRHIISRVLKCYGIGESALEELLHELVVSQSNPTIAFLAKENEMHIRITASAASEQIAISMIDIYETAVRAVVGKYIFAVDDGHIADELHKILVEKQLSLCTAESCTGGLLAAEFTAIPGASGYFHGGVVAYDNSVKINQLEVPDTILARYGAVSAEVATIMADKVREKFGCDIGLSTTGIAGPTGDTPTKPIGLVYIAISDNNGCKVNELRLSGDRELIRKRTVKAIQIALKKYLSGGL